MSDTTIAIRSEEIKPDYAEQSGAVNLASPRLGASLLEVSDEFFGSRTRMLEDAPPVFYPDRYDDHGKWMDGWETRRRRDGGNDYCILQLGAKGVIAGFDLNTRFFTGNHPPRAKIEATLTDDIPTNTTEWFELVPESDIAPDSQNQFPVTDKRPFNYIRLNIFPDGGIARFRVWGNPMPDWIPQNSKGHHELSGTINGGRVVGYSDAHYGDPWIILTPGRGRNMGDGWETRRRRGPGNDWIVVALGETGLAAEIEVDTAHFKGNYPDRCSVQAAHLPQYLPDAKILSASERWDTLMPEQKLQMDNIHTFKSDKISSDFGPINYIRLNIFPDGGISRLRIFGPLTKSS